MVKKYQTLLSFEIKYDKRKYKDEIDVIYKVLENMNINIELKDIKLTKVSLSSAKPIN